MIRALLCLVPVLALLAPATAGAQSIQGLLKKGPLVMVQNNKDEAFESATAIIDIDAPVEKVWSIILDFDHYLEFFPKLVECEVKSRTKKYVEVELEIEVPGGNPEYTLRYTPDEKTHTIKTRWIDGDLKGTYSHYKLADNGKGGTVLYYTNSSKNYSSFAEAIDDDQQTIRIGINVGSALAVARALKRRAEGKPAAIVVEDD